MTNKQYLMIVGMLWLVVSKLSTGLFQTAASLSAAGYVIASVIAAWKETEAKP